MERRRILDCRCQFRRAAVHNGADSRNGPRACGAEARAARTAHHALHFRRHVPHVSPAGHRRGRVPDRRRGPGDEHSHRRDHGRARPGPPGGERKGRGHLLLPCLCEPRARDLQHPPRFSPRWRPRLALHRLEAHGQLPPRDPGSLVSGGVLRLRVDHRRVLRPPRRWCARWALAGVHRLVSARGRARRSVEPPARRCAQAPHCPRCDAGRVPQRHARDARPGDRE